MQTKLYVVKVFGKICVVAKDPDDAEKIAKQVVESEKRFFTYKASVVKTASDIPRSWFGPGGGGTPYGDPPEEIIDSSIFNYVKKYLTNQNGEK